MGLLPISVAEEKGVLEANSLALRWIGVRNPGPGAKMMAAGKADFMLSTFANLMPMEARQTGTLRFLLPPSRIAGMQRRRNPGAAAVQTPRGGRREPRIPLHHVAVVRPRPAERPSGRRRPKGSPS
ncbi:hypothetical protein [uncultured Thiohalocapsa sp.]|uniref:hypothetical protein n=1 Tax=uncultured Thiohalocapsa sp. TaxID=768990 RepID=UPI0025CBF77C|nr:hypothetical protein [uncultured Thiohalocapsa sp.]